MCHGGHICSCRSEHATDKTGCLLLSHSVTATASNRKTAVPRGRAWKALCYFCSSLHPFFHPISPQHPHSRAAAQLHGNAQQHVEPDIGQGSHSRGIHPVIIRHCVENKLLFESADYHNAMFVGYDKDGKARYGALRSTVSSYKGELTGSDKHFSFSLEGKQNPERIHVFESAIDLLSYATLKLLAGRDWKSETYLSLAGVFQTKREDVVPVALSRFLDEHPSVRKIHLHLDNDAVGRGAVKGIVGGLQGKYQVYDEPPSRGKDVNDELKIRVGLMRERKERERT